MAVLGYSRTTEKVDRQTGEVFSKEEVIQKYIESEPEYIKMYLGDIIHLCSLPKSYLRVLIFLLRNVNFANDEYPMCVLIPSGLKRKMMDRIGFSNIRSINNVLSDLAKVGILRRIENSVYQLNPHYFGRGNWKDIRKIRAVVEYDPGSVERKIKTLFEYSNTKKVVEMPKLSDPELPY